MKNLNELTIPTDGGVTLLQRNNVVITTHERIKIKSVFDNLEEELIKLIHKYNNGFVFGCVAWLTSLPILEALSKTNSQILIQKEDFIRPDIYSKDLFKNRLKVAYDKLKFLEYRHRLREPIRSLSICCSPEVDSIRCIGNYNSDKTPAFPRMHHKFMVFCRVDNQFPDLVYKPEVLWTGSFNITKNATMSFENAIVIEDLTGNNPIIESYLNEHHQLFGLSEQLDWEKEWTEPEYRIGT
jgi:phosphatidylserine/phosphatidylglycerophosphate/cardiolipin synthase-like enzyme